MTTISDIPRDLIEEILSRVSITSIRAVRSTCKRWDALSKDHSFTKKHCGLAAKEFMMGIMTYDIRDCLTNVNLHGIYNHKDGLFDSSIKQLGKFNLIEIAQVFYCDRLLLCINNNNDVLVVWNPYLGQVRVLDCDLSIHQRVGNYEIYDLKRNSWKVFDVTRNWNIDYHHRCVTLKGNTYFVAFARGEVDLGYFLVCFDFTRERFGPRLRLPFHSCGPDSVIISTVREEQLGRYGLQLTTKIEPDDLSWNKLLKFDSKSLIRSIPDFIYGSFFVDEKKKVAVICDRKKRSNYYTAYMFGEDGYYKEVDLGESTCWPLVCSYVPSLVQIQQGPVPAGDKSKEQHY
ncbi:hypothetical protein EUTSA_v10022148mg [Eutrema salsugineum]|uniref:F-box domain-containing protein n=1 Tax=Eutrema salsugineum TaxID=72664 RepID=V4LVR5_EUTSA|nr:hypothetical protein EUTSA_v10022148mg [Eutrema salsugineum]